MEMFPFTAKFITEMIDKHPDLKEIAEKYETERKISIELKSQRQSLMSKLEVLRAECFLASNAFATVQEERRANANCVETIKMCYSMLLQVEDLYKNVQPKSGYHYDMLCQQTEMKEQLTLMQKNFNEDMDRYAELEKRDIVKSFRIVQFQLQDAKNELRLTEGELTQMVKKWNIRFEQAKIARNRVILSLVKLWKESTNLGLPQKPTNLLTIPTMTSSSAKVELAKPNTFTSIVFQSASDFCKQFSSIKKHPEQEQTKSFTEIPICDEAKPKPKKPTSVETVKHVHFSESISTLHYQPSDIDSSSVCSNHSDSLPKEQLIDDEMVSDDDDDEDSKNNYDDDDDDDNDKDNTGDDDEKQSKVEILSVEVLPSISFGWNSMGTNERATTSTTAGNRKPKSNPMSFHEAFANFNDVSRTQDEISGLEKMDLCPEEESVSENLLNDFFSSPSSQ